MNRLKRFSGTVRDGKFHLIAGHDNPAYRLTKIRIQEFAFPDSAEVNLKAYENKGVLTEGCISGGWIYSARVLNIQTPFLLS